MRRILPLLVAGTLSTLACSSNGAERTPTPDELLNSIADDYPGKPDEFYIGSGLGLRLHCHIPGDEGLEEVFTSKVDPEDRPAVEAGIEAADDVSVETRQTFCKVMASNMIPNPEFV